MTDYEMRKFAKYQAEYLVEALKKDDEVINYLRKKYRERHTPSLLK